MAQTPSRQRAQERQVADAQSTPPETVEPLAEVPAHLITTEPATAHNVKYTGLSHIRRLSAADLVKIGVPPEDAQDISFDRRTDSSLVVSESVYNALIALPDWNGV